MYLKKSFASALSLCLLLSLVSNVFAEEKKSKAIDAGKKTSAVHYQYVNFALELGDPDLQDFGNKVDQAKESANVHRLSSLALELYMAEQAGGKKASSLSATQLLQMAADLAETQKNKNSLNTVAAAFGIIGNSARAKNYKEVAAKMEQRASETTFDLCVDNWTDQYCNIFIDGQFSGKVGSYGKNCGEDVGFIGGTVLEAHCTDYIYTNTFIAEPWGSYSWTIKQ